MHTVSADCSESEVVLSAKWWGVVATGIVAYTLVVSLKVLFPSSDELERSDAVVSLAPPTDRLPLAIRLQQKFGTGDLVVSRSAAPDSAESVDVALAVEGVGQCGTSTATSSVTCIDARESTTLGEALAVRDLAEQNDWSSVTVVTSRYHVFRSQFIFNRCMPTGTTVHVAFADTAYGKRRWAYHLVYENVAFLKAVVETSIRC